MTRIRFHLSPPANHSVTGTSPAAMQIPIPPEEIMKGFYSPSQEPENDKPEDQQAIGITADGYLQPNYPEEEDSESGSDLSDLSIDGMKDHTLENGIQLSGDEDEGEFTDMEIDMYGNEEEELGDIEEEVEAGEEELEGGELEGIKDETLTGNQNENGDDVCSNCHTKRADTLKFVQTKDGPVLCVNCYVYQRRHHKDRPPGLEAERLAGTRGKSVLQNIGHDSDHEAEDKDVTAGVTKPRRSGRKFQQPITAAEETIAKQVAPVNGNSGAVKGKAVQTKPGRSCVPCSWTGRRCDKGIPCSSCTEWQARRGKTWDCYYDPNFTRPKGPTPAIYRVGNDRTHPAHGNTKGKKALLDKPTNVKRAGVPATTEPRPQRRHGPAMKAATETTHASSNGIYSTMEKSPARFIPKTPIPPRPGPITTVRALKLSLETDVRALNDIAETSPVTQQFLRSAAEKRVLELASNLRHAKLAAYLATEEQIEGSGLAESIKEEMVKENFKGCLADGDWKGGLVV